jgi:integrase
MSHKAPLIEQGVGSVYVDKLASKFKLFLDESDLDSPAYTYKLIEDFAVWLIQKVYTTSSASSWRIYKNAFKKICEFSNLHQHLDNASAYAKPAKRKKQGRKRKRFLDITDMRKLLSIINASNSKYKVVLVDWIKSTELVGLRPNEWEHSSIISPDGHTQVLKAYNTRKSVISQCELASHRYIPLSHLDEHQVEMIARFMSKFKALIKMSSYKDAFELLRSSLKYYVDRAFVYTEDNNSGISIYSARDQFCLNMRASMDDSELVAYFMGHTDNERQRRSYGKINNGRVTATPINARGYLNEYGLHTF